MARPQQPEFVEVVVKIKPDIHSQIVALIEKTKFSWEKIVNDALQMWLLQTDPMTGLRTVSPTAVPINEPEPPKCPHCGHFVITETTKYAEAGFCLFCGEVTVSQDQLDEYHAKLKVYREILEKVG